MSANLYKTKNPGEFYHIHGSLEASTTLNMIGLEGHRPDLTDYEDVIKEIESHVQKYSVAELEEMNKERRQAGVPALKHEDFIKTPHVRRSDLSRLLVVHTNRTKGQAQRRRARMESHSASGEHRPDSIPCPPCWQHQDLGGRQGSGDVPYHRRPNSHPNSSRVRCRRPESDQPEPV